MSFTPEVLRGSRLIPVVVCERVDDALPLAWSLLEAGITCMEITLRSPCALEAMATVVRHCPHMVVGAGTILTENQMQDARLAGAHFFVSPGLTVNLLAKAQKDSLAYLPGVSTCSEIMLALSYGFTHLKFFPASVMGGVPFLKAMAGPFPQIRFCPTGGIDERTASDYLALSHVFAVGGSWMVPRKKD